MCFHWHSRPSTASSSQNSIRNQRQINPSADGHDDAQQEKWQIAWWVCGLQLAHVPAPSLPSHRSKLEPPGPVLWFGTWPLAGRRGKNKHRKNTMMFQTMPCLQRWPGKIPGSNWAGATTGPGHVWFWCVGTAKGGATGSYSSLAICLPMNQLIEFIYY